VLLRWLQWQLSIGVTDSSVGCALEEGSKINQGGCGLLRRKGGATMVRRDRLIILLLCFVSFVWLSPSGDSQVPTEPVRLFISDVTDVQVFRTWIEYCEPQWRSHLDAGIPLREVEFRRLFEMNGQRLYRHKLYLAEEGGGSAPHLATTGSFASPRWEAGYYLHELGFVPLIAPGRDQLFTAEQFRPAPAREIRGIETPLELEFFLDLLTQIENAGRNSLLQGLFFALESPDTVWTSFAITPSTTSTPPSELILRLTLESTQPTNPPPPQQWSITAVPQGNGGFNVVEVVQR